jgi:SAM-dependent methyltransferase
MNLENIKNYFEDKLKEYGPTAEGMDWKNAESQHLRFDILSKYIDFSRPPSILDVGCGAGAFLNYCRSKKLPLTYTGIDIVPASVEYTISQYGAGSAILGTIADLPANQLFDYTIASGTFNAKLAASCDEWRSYFHSSIVDMYKKCRRGAIFNCMTEFVSWKYDRLYYPNLTELCSFITNEVSRSFIMDHSYPLFECTFFIGKHAD